jgi:hypothetical protein
VSVFLIIACEKEDLDTQKPEIDVTIPGAFPSTCSDTIFFGEPFTLKVLLSDNVELATYSLDIHHNFDHHSHSTVVTECELNPVKEPVNPITFIENLDIPQGLKEYETDVLITIPASNNAGQYDEGDYHFHIKLTDKEGWSNNFALGIKMVHQ